MIVHSCLQTAACVIMHIMEQDSRMDVDWIKQADKTETNKQALYVGVAIYACFAMSWISRAWFAKAKTEHKLNMKT